MKIWLLALAALTSGLFTATAAERFYMDPDLEDPKLVAKMPSLGVIYGVNIPNAFVLMNPKTTEGIRVGQIVALHRHGSIVTLGQIEAVDSDTVTIAVKLDLTRGEAYIPRGKEEVVYYPLRLTSVSQLQDEES